MEKGSRREVFISTWILFSDKTQHTCLHFNSPQSSMQISTLATLLFATLATSSPTRTLTSPASLGELTPRGNANTADVLVYPEFECRGTPQRFTLGVLNTCHTTAFTFNSLSIENVGANMFGKSILAFGHPNPGCTSGIGGNPPIGFRLTNGANCHRYIQGDAVFLAVGDANSQPSSF